MKKQGDWAKTISWRLITISFGEMEFDDLERWSMQGSHVFKSSLLWDHIQIKEKAMGINPDRKTEVKSRTLLTVNTYNFPATTAAKLSSNTVCRIPLDLVGAAERRSMLSAHDLYILRRSTLVSASNDWILSKQGATFFFT